MLPAEEHEDQREQRDDDRDDQEVCAVGVAEQADTRQLVAEAPASPEQRSVGPGQLVVESQYEERHECYSREDAIIIMLY